MKKLLVCATLAFLVAASVVAVASEPKSQESSGIHWITDMAAALQLAKSENKPILLDFFNPN